jgi:hypothetical protein
LNSGADATRAMTVVRGKSNPIQGWYAPEFGVRQSNAVLVFSSMSRLPARSGYLIAPADREIVSWSLEAGDVRRNETVKIHVESPQSNVAVQFNLGIA